MDQIFPLTGTTTSCASQDFDFLNYWVDQTVEKEILRGKKLQELKLRPSLRKEKYDVINIGHTNIYSEKKCIKRRNKSPTRSRKKGRSNSPKRKNSPIITQRKFAKKDAKSSQRCPMRIAELSVPSKRQCIDTWRNKSHILPEIMIDRLRQHVLDLSPVVKIPDAIECFMRHKIAERKKTIEAKKKENKMKRKYNHDDYDSCIKICKTKRKPTELQECRYLCAIFGHKIAKELNKPVHVKLNTELQNIANVVSIEIEKLVNKCKRIDNKNVKNNRIHAEVAGKISIWIANILDETAYKIVEDQLQDLEEEVGPVLDVIDDLIDNVVNVYEPEPEIIEFSSSSGTYTYNIESSTEYNEEQEEIKDSESTADGYLSLETDLQPDTEEVTRYLDDFIKNELENIINLFEGDVPPEDEENILTDPNEFIKNELDEIINSFERDAENENDNFTDLDNQKQVNSKDLEIIADNEQNIFVSTDLDNTADNEQNEFVDANDTFGVPINETEIQADASVLQKSSQVEEIITDHQTRDVVKNADPDNIDDILSEDDSNKKVKFKSSLVMNDGTTESQVTSHHFDDIHAPNDHLLSNVDESWPEDMTLPTLRPSESVSKSITSLGRIIEAEEGMSFELDDDTSSKLKGLSTDTKQQIETDANENIKQTDDNPETTNNTIDTIEQSKINEETIENDRNINTKDIEINQDRIEQTVKYIDQDGTTDSKELGFHDDGLEITDEYIVKKETTDTKDEIIHKDETEVTDKHYTGKDVQKIQADLTNLASEPSVRSASIDSTFDHDVPTETVVYEPPLDKILEEQATQVTPILDKELKDEATPVSPKADKELKIEITQIIAEATDGKRVIETVDKEINTALSLVSRADKSTSIVSQSLADITKRFQGVKAYQMFSSMRVKPKVDYRVHINSAPSWATQNYAEPSDSPPYTNQPSQKKESNDRNIRLWCKDLENGFDNLELWNGWIENTVQSVKIMEMKKARICIDKTREEFVKDWMHLKKNVDTDVLTWSKLNSTTQEKMKGFRKICQNLETLPSKQNKSCNYHP